MSLIPAGLPLPLPVSTPQALLKGWSNPCSLDQCLSSVLFEDLLQTLLLALTQPSAWITFTPTLISILFALSLFVLIT